ncbi:MAG TPA: tetratricopeptide repeat protein, partial [Candidatus Thermoplasmatota archaeon]
INEKDADAQFNLGNVLADLQRYEEAVSAYRSSLDSDGENEFAWINLGIALKTMGQADEAKKAGMKAKSLNPNNPELAKLLEGL